MSGPIRVVVVDDSAFYRGLLERILSSDPELEVVATASDPYARARRSNSSTRT